MNVYIFVCVQAAHKEEMQLLKLCKEREDEEMKQDANGRMRSFFQDDQVCECVCTCVMMGTVCLSCCVHVLSQSPSIWSCVQMVEERELEVHVPSKETRLSISISLRSHIQKKEEKDEEEYEGKQPRDMPPTQHTGREKWGAAATTLSTRSRIPHVIRPATTTPTNNVPTFSSGGVSGGKGGRREVSSPPSLCPPFWCHPLPLASACTSSGEGMGGGRGNDSLASCLQMEGGGGEFKVGSIVAQKVVKSNKDTRALFLRRMPVAHMKTRRAGDEMLEATGKTCTLDLVSFTHLLVLAESRPESFSVSLSFSLRGLFSRSVSVCVRVSFSLRWI